MSYPYYFNSISSISDDLSAEELVMPLPYLSPSSRSSGHNNNNNNNYYHKNNLDLIFNNQYKQSPIYNYHRYHMNNNNNNININSNNNNKSYKIIEEEYYDMNNQQQRKFDLKQQQQQHQNNGLDNFLNTFNHVTEEHFDLTHGSNGGGGSNGGIIDSHSNDASSYNMAQRRSSFKKHYSTFGLSQPDGSGQGLQRSLSAQNIHIDSRLAESERNLNYCVRFAVNGLSKTHMGSIPSINKNIQAGDFGDDAGMIAENSKCIVIGLADGAGGNREIGIDPKKFSRALLGFCVEIIKNEEVLPHQVSRLVTKAIQHLETRNIVGSGTLCLLSLNKETNIMSTMNLGDSGFRLVRQGKIRHKSNATMAGSSPRQVFVTESRYSGISFIDENDIGRDADLREFRVKKGDLIVLSSDGLFDVLKDSEIERVCNSHNPKDLQGMADELLQLSMRSYLHTHRDDILVMVCRVELKKGF